MSISTPIQFKVGSKNKEPIELLEGMRAVKSETTSDSITYDFEFSFQDNENRLKIHVAVNFLVLSITFDPDDKEQYNWAKNGGNNKYGMFINRKEYRDSDTNLDMCVTQVINQKVSGFFGKKTPAILTVKQNKKIKEKSIETIIYKENILDDVYAVSIPTKDGESFVSAVFGKSNLSLYYDETHTELEVRELPCVSTGFLYFVKK